MTLHYMHAWGMTRMLTHSQLAAGASGRARPYISSRVSRPQREFPGRVVRYMYAVLRFTFLFTIAHS